MMLDQHPLRALSRRRTASQALALAGLAMLSLARPSLARAADPNQPPSVTVSFGDLDMSTPQGAERLYQRLTVAAAAVCPSYDVGDLQARRVSQLCRKDALSRALEALQSSEVAAIQAARQGRS